jgi:hypothetical protein
MLHYPGKIEGEVEHLQTIAEKLSCAGEAGIGSSAYYYFEIAESILQLFDYSSGCVDLTNTYSVEPDTFFGRVFASDFAESLCPASPVTVLPNHSVNDFRADSHKTQKVYEVYNEFHCRTAQILK